MNKKEDKAAADDAHDDLESRHTFEGEEESIASQTQIMAAISNKYSLEEEDENSNQDAWQLALTIADNEPEESTSLRETQEYLYQEKPSKSLEEAQMISNSIVAEMKIAAGLPSLNPSKSDDSSSTAPPMSHVALQRSGNYRANTPGAVAVAGTNQDLSSSDDQTIQIGGDVDEESPTIPPTLTNAVLVPGDDSNRKVEGPLVATTSQPIVAAVQVDDNDQNQAGGSGGPFSILRDKRVCCILSVLLIVILVLGITMGVLFSNANSQSTAPTLSLATFQPTPEPTPVPTRNPTPGSTQSPTLPPTPFPTPFPTYGKPYPNWLSCQIASDCKSNRCVNNICTARLADGETCNIDGECASSHCQSVTNECRTYPYVNGIRCLIDNHCASGRCDFDFFCKAKESCGETCGRNSDCVSESCSWRFTCSC